MASKQGLSSFSELIIGGRRRRKTKWLKAAFECVLAPRSAKEIATMFNMDNRNAKLLLNRGVSEKILESDLKDGIRYWYMSTKVIKSLILQRNKFNEIPSLRRIDKKQLKNFLDMGFKLQETEGRRAIYEDFKAWDG